MRWPTPCRARNATRVPAERAGDVRPRRRRRTACRWSASCRSVSSAMSYRPLPPMMPIWMDIENGNRESGVGNRERNASGPDGNRGPRAGSGTSGPGIGPDRSAGPGTPGKHDMMRGRAGSLSSRPRQPDGGVHARTAAAAGIRRDRAPGQPGSRRRRADRSRGAAMRSSSVSNSPGTRTSCSTWASSRRANRSFTRAPARSRRRALDLLGAARDGSGRSPRPAP